jgi:SAM-dependent methyltransferase
VNTADENKIMRRVAGAHNFRLDGIGDLLMRAREASVFDIGCNRGHVAYEFALNGANVVHGCDIYEPGIRAAREWFADLRQIKSQFEVVDLTLGSQSLGKFGSQRYDIVVLLATYHKLKRVMTPEKLSALMRATGDRTLKWFAWRGTSEKINENEGELLAIDKDMKACGLKRVHTSYLSMQLGVAAIWQRL